LQLSLDICNKGFTREREAFDEPLWFDNMRAKAASAWDSHDHVLP
jgi:hypothetical protein